MTYPIDQFVSLTKANGYLVFKLSEIARESGEDYIKIGRKAVSGLVDQVKAVASEAFPRFNDNEATTLLSEIEKSREAALGKTKAAFAEWQGSWKDAWATASEQRGGLEVFQGLLQPWFAPLNPALNPAPELETISVAPSHEATSLA